MRVALVLLLSLAAASLLGALMSDAWCAELEVARIEICTAIEEREPAGSDSLFSSELEVLYCFTEIKGAEDSTAVTHLWSYGEREMAEITLPVKSMRWRTWSSKRLVEGWKGDWMVQVLSADGDVLAERSFTLE